MESALGKLVNFENSNGLELIGLLFEPSSTQKKCIVIHIHGNYGNSYNNKFIWYMSKSYTQNGISFLTFNLSAHDGLCEGYRRGCLDYIGGGVSAYDESLLDICAAVAFVRNLGYKQIVLQGHSLGCDKVIEYAIKYNIDNIKLILLSPVDSYAVQKKWLRIHKSESIEEQIRRLKLGKSTSDSTLLDWLDMDEYGAEGLNSDWVYKIPITRKALISILEGSAFKYLNLECGYDFSISLPTFFFLGTKDGLQMCSQQKMRNFLECHFANGYYEDTLNSDHDIIGVEQTLVDRIIHWLTIE